MTTPHPIVRGKEPPMRVLEYATFEGGSCVGNRKGLRRIEDGCLILAAAA